MLHVGKSTFPNNSRYNSLIMFYWMNRTLVQLKALQCNGSKSITIVKITKFMDILFVLNTILMVLLLWTSPVAIKGPCLLFDNINRPANKQSHCLLTTGIIPPIKNRRAQIEEILGHIVLAFWRIYLPFCLLTLVALLFFLALHMSTGIIARNILLCLSLILIQRREVVEYIIDKYMTF